MSGCDSDRLEALVNDEAPSRRDPCGDPGARRRVRALRGGARLAARRAAPLRGADASRPFARSDLRIPGAPASFWAPAEPPPFADVLARVRRERRSRWERWAPGLGLAAAAAFALVAMSALGARAPAPVAAVAEPMADFTCYDDPRSLAVEATAYATDRAVASAEDHYGACLMATPAVILGGACERPSSTVMGAAIFTDESDVTCRPLRPLDDEVFASRICGGSLQ